MIKILFVCYGNICRSPMAEFIMKDIVVKHNLSDKFIINSKAVTSSETGASMDSRSYHKLIEKGIPIGDHHASMINHQDLETYDYIICMDDLNMNCLERLFGPNPKFYKLMYFVGTSNDVVDPWYTNDFETAYIDIVKGCNALYTFLEKNNKIY